MAQLIKNPPAIQEIPVRFLTQEDLLQKGYATTPVFLGFPCGSAGKKSAYKSDTDFCFSRCKKTKKICHKQTHPIRNADENFILEVNDTRGK